ncbi:PAS domain-containing protein [Polaribacter sp. MSW13]|uniref:histidine kinase n=1 Tax=Polaribacter marinus TaxID=2916838 RepID=A0A9X2AJU1_9FLAO|nr:PAS domain-containing protein [Polaribacter marinus]MCI2229377.1 PAS domain-containing protein [Polaribacter marinus]
MNYSQIAILFMQGTLVALVMLLLFHFRKQLGIGVMFACLGLFQFVQVSLYSAVSISITDNFLVSPSSAVYFTATLFVLLMVYIKDDTTETKKTIYALFIVNIVMSVLLETLNWHFNNLSTAAQVKLPQRLFNINSWGLFVNTILLFIDAFLIIILFEYIAKRIRFLFLQIFITMLIVIIFDTLIFTTIVFWNLENLESILISGLISKGVFTIFYSILLYSYLILFDSREPLTFIFNIKDVFQPLTYKQKFESAEKVIQKNAEMYQILTDHSKDLIFLQEPDSSFKYISPTIKKLLGYEQSEFIGKFIFSIVHKDDVLSLKDTLNNKLFSKGIAKEAIPFRVRHKNGHYIWLEFLSSPVYTGKEISYFVTIARDVTQRVLANKKLETSLELFESSEFSKNEASKIAKIGYWEHDLVTDVVVWSDYIYHIFGLHPKDGIPKEEEIFRYFDKDSQDKLIQATLDLKTKGVHYDIELKWINLKNEVIWVRNVAQPIYNEKKEIVGKRGILQNIVNSKKAQQELELSKQEIQTTLDLLETSEYSKNEASKTAKIGYHQYDIATDTFIWSDYLYHFFGFDPKKPVPPRNEIVVLFDEDSQNKMAKATVELDNKGIPYDLELRIINLKNEEVWVRNIAAPVYNEKNKIVGRRGITQDITASKKGQLELEHSKNKLEASLELVKENEYLLKEASRMASIGYWGYDKQTDTISWSDSLHKIYGTNPEEGVPKIEEILNFFNKESREKLVEATAMLASKGVRFEIELQMINAKKEKRWILNIGEGIFNDKNEIIGRRGVSQDITQQKLIEQKNLIVSENYKKLFDNATVSILNEDLSLAFKQILELKKLKIPNLELYFNQNPQVLLTILNKVKIVKVNKATLKLFKVNSSQEFIENIQDTFGKGANKVFGKFIEAIWNNEKIFISEVNYKTLKGDEFAAVVSIPIPQTEIEQKTVPISIQSIQSIRDAEYAQRESLKMLRSQSKFITAMTENQPAGIIACDANGKLVLFNKVAKEWHGIDALNISQKKWAENYGLYKEDGETLLENHEIPLVQAFNDKKVANVEIVIKAKNKKPRIVVCNGTSFSDSTGNKLGALIVMNDITQQKFVENNLKRSQSEIKRSEFLLNESGRLAKVGAWEIELASQKIRWSEQVFEIHGIPVGEVPPLDECISFYVDGSDKIIAQAIEESIAENKKFDLVLRFKNVQNQKLWINAIGYPLTNSEGKITSIIGVFQDITLQKTRQNKLDAQNEKLFKLNNALNEAQQLSHLGSWEYILATDKVTWSKELFNIFERKYELGAPNYSEHKLLYTEESFVLMNDSVNNCIQDQTPYNIELDIYTTNGSIKHIRSRGRVIKDKDHKVIGCYGTAQDITEEKKISLKIQKADEMYRILTDNSNDLICLHKPDSTFKYISPSVETLLGYQQAELQGEKALSIVHKEDVDELKEILKKRALKGVFIETFSCRVLHKKGHYVWLEFLASPVYKNKEISHFVSSARDISQSVIVKKEIEEYQTSLQKLTTEITLIEEKQKKEIASNIHDHLSQSLVISKMKINELKKNPQLKGTEEDLKFIETHISTALENSRKITYELSPPILYQLGIIDALGWLLEEIETIHKIKCQLTSNVDYIKLSDIESILLYRSIQEVINNTIKYAKASLITLEVDKNTLGVNLFVRDNGAGFDTSKLYNNIRSGSGSGFGLFTVQERIKNIQGEFNIKSKKNIGTTVSFFIPLSKRVI